MASISQAAHQEITGKNIAMLWLPIPIGAAYHPTHLQERGMIGLHQNGPSARLNEWYQFLVVDIETQNHEGWKRPLRSSSATINPSRPCPLSQVTWLSQMTKPYRSNNLGIYQSPDKCRWVARQPERLKEYRKSCTYLYPIFLNSKELNCRKTLQFKQITESEGFLRSSHRLESGVQSLVQSVGGKKKNNLNTVIMTYTSLASLIQTSMGTWPGYLPARWLCCSRSDVQVCVTTHHQISLQWQALKSEHFALLPQTIFTQNNNYLNRNLTKVISDFFFQVLCQW